MKRKSFNKGKKDLDFREIMQNLFLGLTILGVIFSLRFTFMNINDSNSINVVLILPFILFLTPYLVMKLYDLKKVEAKMQVIPRFLRDVVDNVESGMDLISAIKTTTGNEYSVLNEDIAKLSNQLSWGIDFDDAFLNFAKNVGSHHLKKDFTLIVEARKVGGHVEKLLRELSEKINTENLIIKQRKSNLASNTFTGYISFLIFILIIILVYNNLFLELGTSMGGEQNSEVNNQKLAVYLTLFTLLSYELAILSGFLFGMMQESNIISGAPHVVILMLITFIGFFFFVH